MRLDEVTRSPQRVPDVPVQLLRKLGYRQDPNYSGWYRGGTSLTVGTFEYSITDEDNARSLASGRIEDMRATLLAVAADQTARPSPAAARIGVEVRDGWITSPNTQDLPVRTYADGVVHKDYLARLDRIGQLVATLEQLLDDEGLVHCRFYTLNSMRISVGEVWFQIRTENFEDMTVCLLGRTDVDGDGWYGVRGPSKPFSREETPVDGMAELVSYVRRVCRMVNDQIQDEVNETLSQLREAYEPTEMEAFLERSGFKAHDRGVWSNTRPDGMTRWVVALHDGDFSVRAGSVHVAQGHGAGQLAKTLDLLAVDEDLTIPPELAERDVVLEDGTIYVRYFSYARSVRMYYAGEPATDFLASASRLNRAFTTLESLLDEDVRLVTFDLEWMTVTVDSAGYDLFEFFVKSSAQLDRGGVFVVSSRSTPRLGAMPETECDDIASLISVIRRCCSRGARAAEASHEG